MAFSLRDMLRYLHGGESKPKPAFQTEKEAYDFCRNLYKRTGGVTPELRRAFDFYQKNMNEDACGPFHGPERGSHLSAHVKG